MRPALVLIIIDMLADFFERAPSLAAQREQLVHHINELSECCRNANVPIIWVRQEFAPDLHDAFLEMRRTGVSITLAGTAGCQVLPELTRRADDLVVVKKRYSAFFGTGLDQLLGEIEPESLVLAGINTHACIRMTAIDAYQRDYDVILATDCIGSNDIEHHDVTLRYLEGRIVTVMSNAEIASRARAGPSLNVIRQ